MNSTKIAVLPVGEFDSDLTRHEFEGMVEVFNRLGSNLFIAEPVSGEEEARRSVQVFLEKDPDLFLFIPLSGLSAQAMEAAGRMSQAPCLIWPVQGRFALPSSALAVGAMRESNLPVELFYAPADQPASIERIRCIVRAAKAYTRIRRSRIGVIGGLFPNLVSCRYDPRTVTSRLGLSIIPISFDEIRASRQATSLRLAEMQRSQQEMVRSYNVNAEDEPALEAGIQLHLALKQVAQEKQIDGFATECWSGFPRELGLNPCMGFVEDAYTLACEGDVMLCASLLLVRYLTGTGAYTGDLYDLDLDGNLTLVHCGAPASLATSRSQVVLAKSQPALERGFETMTCRPRLELGSVTLFRFYGRNCDEMHVGLGDLLESEPSPNLRVRVKISGDRWDFLSQVFGNHYVVAAGNLRNELRLLCRWLGIRMYET
jgi:L-fucose isomerase-like protein